jgi:hypothetical protein
MVQGRRWKCERFADDDDADNDGHKVITIPHMTLWSKQSWYTDFHIVATKLIKKMVIYPKVGEMALDNLKV